MSTLKKISLQTFWQILGKVVTSLSTFIILGLVARNYGEEGTGVFTLTLTYLAIFYLLSDFGFNAHILKKFQVINSKLQVDEVEKLLGTRILWSVFLIMIALGLLYFSSFTSSEFFQSVLFGCLAILASAAFVTCNLVFQNRLRYDLSVLASSAGTLVGLIASSFLITAHFPIHFVLLAHLWGWLTIAGVALFLTSKIFEAITPIYSLPYTKNLFKESWPIAATLVLNVIYFRADSFMIAYFKSTAEAGIYNVAYSVFQTALVLPTFIMNSYYPLMLKSFSKIKLAALGLLSLAFLGAAILIVCAPIVIVTLTGGGFPGASNTLQILSLGLPAYFLSALLMWVMIVKEKYKTTLLIYAVGLVLNLILNFLYIPKYSFFASAWITVASEYAIVCMQAVVLLLKSK